MMKLYRWLPVRHRPILVALTMMGLAASACTSNATANSDGAIAVTSTDDACEISPTESEGGTITFDVVNEGSQVTEFYLLAEDGLRVIGEVENIGPGLNRQMVVTAPKGSYVTACKPGMVGDGIRGDFTVTSDGDQTVDPEVAGLLETATAQYQAYVEDQAAQLMDGTQQFADLYVSGDDDAARALYPVARTHWERIEPVAESFGDLDPILDAREADLEPGQEWTGWHRIEKDLWPPDEGYTPLTDAERAEFADGLVANTTELVSRIQELTYTPDQLGNGAKELLDEVATGKVTGEEEIWSHTDLWDFQANLDGARVAFEVLEPVLEVKDPDLATTLTERFAEVQSLLDQYRTPDGEGFVPYTDLSTEQVKELSDAVNALSEPLSELTAAVLL